MESNLRPLTLSEILDRTAQLYRSNFLLFAGIFALYAGVALVLNLMQIGILEWLRMEHMDKALVWLPMISSGVEMLVLFLLMGAAIAAISRAVAWLHVGEPATIRGAYQSIRPRLGRYLWLMAITAIIAWLPLALLYGGLLGAVVHYGKSAIAHPAVGVAASKPNPQAAFAIVIVFLIFGLPMIPAAIYAVWMNLRYALAVPACVVEGLNARAAIRRSIELSKGSRGRIFVLFLLIGVIKLGLVGITQSFFVIAAVKQHGHVSAAMNALSVIIAFFTNTFLGPIGATGVTLFYYDQRIRKEGYDIEWMMEAAGMTAPALDAAAEEDRVVTLAQPEENQA